MKTFDEALLCFASVLFKINTKKHLSQHKTFIILDSSYNMMPVDLLSLTNPIVSMSVFKVVA